MKRISRAALLVFGSVALAWPAVVLADTLNAIVTLSNPASSVPGHIDALERSTTLCEPKEVIVFSCTLAKKKIVSLCASKDAGNNTGYMQYRFGRDASSIELEYPQRKAPAKEFFKYDNSDLGTAAISFRIGEYRYSLYNTHYRRYAGAGVILNRDRKHDRVAIRVSYFKCIGAPIVHNEMQSAIPFHDLKHSLDLPDAKGDISYDGAETWSAGPEPESEFYHPKPGEPEDWRLRAKH